jgi:ubiquinone/menaquinone biosynthesis C-methylase UbiE
VSTVDVYRITDKLDPATLDVMVARLEVRGRHPRFAAMTAEYLDAMAIDSSRSVLDLGCGTGVVARAIARRPAFKGKVTGIDRASYLVEAATRFARDEGVADRVDFRAGDSHTLALRDAAFDAAVAHTLFSHLDDPHAVLGEMARVVKPGGRLAIFDGDYASMTFAGDDPVKSKANDETIIGAIVTNPLVMRRMPQMLREAGLRLDAAFAYVLADIGRADFWEGGVASFAKLLPKSGAMTEGAAAQWVAELMRRSEQGIFFGASNFYSYVATKS